MPGISGNCRAVAGSCGDNHMTFDLQLFGVNYVAHAGLYSFLILFDGLRPPLIMPPLQGWKFVWAIVGPTL